MNCEDYPVTVIYEQCAEDYTCFADDGDLKKNNYPTPQKQNQRKVRRDARRRAKR